MKFFAQLLLATWTQLVVGISVTRQASLQHLQEGIDEYSPVGRLKYAERSPLLQPETTLPIEAELGMISAKVLGGGSGAVKSLVRAHTLANYYEGRDKVAKFAPLGLACKILMSRESTPDKPRYLCQSLLAKVTDMPVSSQGVIAKSGEGIGKISTITVPSPTRLYQPDRDVEKLRQGATTDNTIDGGIIDWHSPTYYESD